jgi:hypothetical protein
VRSIKLSGEPDNTLYLNSNQARINSHSKYTRIARVNLP